MDIGEIKSQVRSFVTGNFYVADPAALADDASLLDQGIIDSTGVLEVIMVNNHHVRISGLQFWIAAA